MAHRRTAGSSAIASALFAAFLFGASIPAAKVLVGEMSALWLAGLLYAGSGAGLTLWLVARGARRVTGLSRADLPWLAGAVLCGGALAPVLLMLGLAVTSASAGALLLNLEGVFTAILAWFVFKENFDRRIALGMALIVAGGALLSLRPDETPGTASIGALAIAMACLAWAVDNNLTRRISAGDPVQIAAIKGIAAGAVNLALAAASGAAWPGAANAAAAAAVGLLGYGVSLALFVVALRELGAARTGAYFSIAPFVGAAIAMFVLAEIPPALFWAAALFMATGVWLHVTERHEHTHVHEPMEHAHSHVHDEHHAHEHDFDWDGGEPHAHAHRHARLAHSHPHYPDIHHRHGH